MSCSRRVFLQMVPPIIGVAALPQILSGCIGGSDTPISGTLTLTNGMGTLPFAQYAELSTVNGGVLVDSDLGVLAIVRTGTTTAAALSAICTHQGCTMNIPSSGTELDCPCHGSVCSLSGQVLQGPANRPVAVYTATVTATGIDVTAG